jgi:hypothetical protein
MRPGFFDLKDLNISVIHSHATATPTLQAKTFQHLGSDGVYLVLRASPLRKIDG